MATEKPKIWTIRAILSWTTQFFRERNIDSPRLDAEIILAYSLGIQRVDLYLQCDRPLNATELATYKANMLARVRERKPVAYITGEREFWSLPLKVSNSVLIPRPDTETLVEYALDWLKKYMETPENLPITIIDVGTGSGALALALASELEPEKRNIIAVDISQEALEVAKQNAKDLNFDENLSFIKSDLLTEIQEEADLIVSNPPYISQSDLTKLSPEVKNEPRLALDGGADGLAIYRRLIPQAFNKLKTGGCFVTEIGYDQGESVSGLFRDAGFANILVKKDYGGQNRLVAGVKGNTEN